MNFKNYYQQLFLENESFQLTEQENKMLDKLANYIANFYTKYYDDLEDSFMARDPLFEALADGMEEYLDLEPDDITLFGEYFFNKAVTPELEGILRRLLLSDYRFVVSKNAAVGRPDFARFLRVFIYIHLKPQYIKELLEYSFKDMISGKWDDAFKTILPDFYKQYSKYKMERIIKPETKEVFGGMLGEL